MQPLPNRLFATDALLTPEELRALVGGNLTNHFRVARKPSGCDDCQLVLVSPDVPMGDKSPAFALANFIKTTLHSFPATLTVENERLVHGAPVNQINFTRRVRSEEPRDLDEHIEEVRRFAHAVLLVAPPPGCRGFALSCAHLSWDVDDGLMEYLSFEKSVEALAKRAAALREAVESEADALMLDEPAHCQLGDIYARLTPWQQTQVARHPSRPHFVHYVQGLFEEFLPLGGARLYGNDQAIIGGFAQLGGRPV